MVKKFNWYLQEETTDLKEVRNRLSRTYQIVTQGSGDTTDVVQKEMYDSMTTE